MLYCTFTENRKNSAVQCVATGGTAIYDYHMGPGGQPGKEMVLNRDEKLDFKTSENEHIEGRDFVQSFSHVFF